MRYISAKAYDKVMHGHGIFTLLRSTITSQISSWSDMAIRMIFFAFILSGLDPFYRSNISVAVGAVVGGVINCTLNYRFTFHASDQNVKAVIVKYIMVWTGSLLLNMYGTTFVSMLASRWQYLLDIGFKPDGIFAASTLLVSLIVSLAWNFVLQRSFVYRPSRFDTTAIRIVNFFIPRPQGRTKISKF